MVHLGRAKRGLGRPKPSQGVASKGIASQLLKGLRGPRMVKTAAIQRQELDPDEFDPENSLKTESRVGKKLSERTTLWVIAVSSTKPFIYDIQLYMYIHM